ncbi:hypothetical protein ZOSMA_34G00600 [Zostera marina]|uniref:Uncharacterized protein n=1 Tax=Zostera marina TaxID=29655 RepID=A0A0K9P955_ZOSMR|nr:hypothetical protein ZOSMA_34G00600 [Zostera marina]
MILRTPKKRSRLESTSDQPQSIHECIPTRVSDRRLVLYNDPSSSDQLEEQSDMVCTYHCRQMVKSEFMDALGSAEKEVSDCQSKLKTMSQHLDTKSEKEKFRQRILALEQELAASKGRENSLQERLLKEVSDSHNKYQQQATHSSELEIQLKKEEELRRNADSLAFVAKENAADAEQKLKHFSESAQREKQILLKEISESQSEAKTSHSRLNMELERMKFKADCAVEESDLLREKMENYVEKLNEGLSRRVTVLLPHHGEPVNYLCDGSQKAQKSAHPSV